MKTKKCKCGNEFKQFSSLKKYCSISCLFLFEKNKTNKNKPVRYRIKPVSENRKRDISIYFKERKKILKDNPNCSVYPQLKSTEIHHMKGRLGYADSFAHDRNIKLLFDRRFLLPVSRAGHQKIENNPEWAKQQGFSLTRLDTFV